MPELPEVESIRRTLVPRVVGRRVVSAVLHRRDVLVAPGDPFGGFSRQRGSGRAAAPAPVGKAALLTGAEVVELRRLGKQLAIVGRWEDGRRAALGVQLGMSGQLLHVGPGQAPARRSHIHATWRLDDGSRLIFRDPRRFGGLRVFPSVGDLEAHWGDLGPDGLTLTAARLRAGLGRTCRTIKAALMDQAVVAGVGNIYADEALFAAGVRPDRPCDRLTPRELEAIARAVRAILAKAVKARGSTLRDYTDVEGRPGGFQLKHAVYGRGGKPCRGCGRMLESGTLAQRTTVWCPACQT